VSTIRVGIMQPYFLPYIGYFQLIAAADVFVVYDNIKYTKKGWINRNRMLQNGAEAVFSIPLKKGADWLDVRDRAISEDFDRDKLLKQFAGAYRRAPCFAQTFPLLERIVRHDDQNLFAFLRHSIVRICEHLGIKTAIETSSTIAIDHALTSEEKVLALCKALGARTYLNAIGGMELYSKDRFRDQGIELKFLKSGPFEYSQFGNPFVPWLSIADVLMFNPLARIRACVTRNFELI